MTFKHFPIVLLTLLMVSCCSVSTPQEPPCIPEPGKFNSCEATYVEDHTPQIDPDVSGDPENPSMPPRGNEIKTDWESITEQCEWQPETEWCKIECTTERADDRSWCEGN
jgi:hypothetical protein